MVRRTELGKARLNRTNVCRHHETMAASSGQSDPSPVVSVVLPCLDEEDAVGGCVDQIRNALDEAGIVGEVIVCDNGSTDRSAEIAERHGARVVREPERGYG